MSTLPKYYAFFDVDGTLLKGTSMLNYLRFFYSDQFKHAKVIGEIKYGLFILKAKIYIFLGKSREFLNKNYYQCFKNKEVSTVQSCGERWFDSYFESNDKGIYIKKILNELIAHQNNGAEVVFVSGSFSACLNPLAKKLGIKHILSTRMEERVGLYTGNILAPQVIGEGKAVFIQEFLKKLSFNDLKNCYAYGDHYSDIHMLSLVGNPRVVSGDRLLEQHAIKHSWNIISI